MAKMAASENLLVESAELSPGIPQHAAVESDCLTRSQPAWVGSIRKLSSMSLHL